MKTLYFFAIELLTKVREMWAVAKIRSLGQHLIGQSKVLADDITSQALIDKSRMKELRADPTDYSALDEAEIGDDYAALVKPISHKNTITVRDPDLESRQREAQV